MARWTGIIGFSNTKETAPGIYVEDTIEKRYCGEITRDYRKSQERDKINTDISISNQISIISDRYIFNNLPRMIYISFAGQKWRIESVDINDPPRITITLGGLYVNS